QAQLTLAGAQPAFFPASSPSFSGGLVVSAGATLIAQTNSLPFGTGTLTLTNATIQAGLPLTPSTPLIISNPIYVNGNTLNVAGVVPVNFTGLGVLSNSSTINVPGTATFSNSIFENANARTLAITGLGTINLAGGNSLTGVFNENQSSGAALSSGTLI